MAYVRLRDLTLSFEPDGRVLARCLPRGIGARLPVAALTVLHFCGEPREPEAIAAALGPRILPLVHGLVDAGLLVAPEEADATPLMFEGFARLDAHARMLGDRPRLAAYEAALRALVHPGDTVIDAGCGTGILALLAARAGAGEVIGVEASDLAALAEAVFARNGIAGRVLQGDFARAVTGPADLVVTETFGALAFAEGAAEDLAPLVARCGARAVIPSAVSLFLAPVTGAQPHDAVFGAFSGHGLDLSPLTELGAGLGHTTRIEPEALGAEPARLARVPFPTVSAAQGEVAFAVDPATVRGLAAWFTLHLAPGVELDTAPSAPATHWKQVYLPLPALPAGDTLALSLDVHPDPADRRGLELLATIDGRTHQWRLR